MHAYQLKSIALMHDKSEKAVECSTRGDLSKARELIDELRFLRAVFIKTLDAKQDMHVIDIGEGQHPQNLANQVAGLNTNLDTISRWLNAAKLAFSQEELVRSREGIDIYLDTQIPPIWNWLEDLIILPNDPKGEFSTALAARGQNKIIVLANGQNQKNIRHIGTPADALPALRDWIDDPIGQQLFISTSEGSERDETLMKEIKEVFLGFHVRDSTIRAFSSQWALQQIENLIQVVSRKNVQDLAPVFSGKKCIIVSPGPSLKKNIASLERNTHDHIIIAIAQACPAFSLHNILPDFVVVIDPMDYSVYLDGTDCSKIPGLIISDVCHPALYKKPFQNIFTFFAQRPALNTADIIGAQPMPIFGGSVSVTAVYLAARLGASEISLIGSDLAFQEEIYYGDIPRFGEEALTVKELTSPSLVIPGYFGDEVTTKQDYLIFKRELEELAATSGNNLTLNNCTEGGAYIEGFNHIPLTEVLSEEAAKKKSFDLPQNSTNEVNENLKKLSEALNAERFRLNKANSLARDCLQLAARVNSPEHKKLPTLNKKEKNLLLAIKNSESLGIICMAEIAAIQRQIKHVNSFEGNITLSKSMYKVIIAAIEVIRTALSEQISVLKTTR
jgi:hypothetical protein